ncbi:MAG: ATP-binding cassette domain-containing protein, partial [Lapillicoccus sp.]
EETLDLLGIAELRRRALRTLSGGQQQRVAIGSVLTMHPQVLVMDEPTSALDPTAAEEVLATLARLVQDLGTTVVLAEHRMERVVPFADVVISVDDHGRVRAGDPATMLRETAIAPPIIELGRAFGWDPLPLSVRDARRVAGPLRERLATIHTSGPALSTSTSATTTKTAAGTNDPTGAVDPPLPPALTSEGVVVSYGPKVAVRDVALTLRPGHVVAMMGRNGSGKSSLLWALQGSGPRQRGHVRVSGQDPKALSSKAARALVGLVPQTASDLLYLETVGAECRAGDAESGAAPGSCRDLLDSLAPGIDEGQHPRDLSEGQRLSLVLAVQLTAAPGVLLLDEPTRGLDYPAKRVFGRVLRQLADAGTAIAIATHDVEFVAAVADEALVMAEGEIVSQGSTRDVLGGSPAFAPQVAKILGEQWLTVAEVTAALERGRQGVAS